MSRSTCRRSIRSRSGFTLLEMMLVLGLIAVFAGMTLPSVMRMFGQQKLTASAERVREAIASARVRAIETGLVYQFCCEPNGVHYVVVPFELDHVASQTGNQGGGTNLAGRGMGRLPKGVTFSSEQMGVVSSAVAGLGQLKLAAASLDGLPDASGLASLNWSTPILFKPDGYASADTQITLSDSRSQHIRLRVRAFTGAVSMERLVVGKR